MALGAGLDYFKFQNENWIVPLCFDDRVGISGVITVKVTFASSTTNLWDLLCMKVPVEELHLDSSRNGKSRKWRFYYFYL